MKTTDTCGGRRTESSVSARGVRDETTVRFLRPPCALVGSGDRVHTMRTVFLNAMMPSQYDIEGL